MKYLSLLLFVGFFCACGSNEAPANEEAPAPEASLTTSTEKPEVNLCSIISEADAQALLGCNATPKQRGDARDGRTTCQYSCSAPFSNLSMSVVWTKDGKDQDVSRRDDNPALTKIDVPGADAAHLSQGQGRLMLAKGKYLVEVQLVPNNEAALAETGAKILAGLD
ncbi:MAG: hypothetical protein AAFN92_14535 [Bacteroidota bacterium]